MEGWLEFIEQDLLVIFSGLEGRDLAIPVCSLAMLMLLLVPLKSIDRQDVICGMIYVVYCVAAGTIFFFAIPGVQDGLTAIGLHLAFTCLLGAVAAYRWFHSTNDFVINQREDSASPKAQEPLHEKK